MRIALATSSFDPYIGGVEEHVRNVARILRDRGHDVVVWTIARDGGFGIRAVDGIEVWDLPAPLPARSVRAVLEFLLRVGPAALRWRRAFRAHRPELIHVQCFGPNGTYGRILAAWSRTPLIVTAHGETLADDAGVFTNSRLAIQSLRKGLVAAAAVTGCSQVTLDDLTERFGLPRGTGIVVMNGIDLDEPAAQPRGARGRYVLAVGRLQRMKGFDLLIEAFSRARLPDDLRLVIAGGGPELESLRGLSERLGVASRIEFVGWVDRAVVGALHRDAIIGAVPSRFESFGVAALETWRGGSALVATSRGGPPEFVTDGLDGILVDPEDIAALADVLGSLASDEVRRAALAEAGTVRVRDFTWDATVDGYESLYRQVLGAHAERADTDIT